MSALELIKDTLAIGDEHLGDLVWWTLADARARCDTVTSVWAAQGLDEDLLPEQPTSQRTFKTAVKETQPGHPNVLLRLAKDDADELVYGVVRESRHPDGRLTYVQDARVGIDWRIGQVASDAPEHAIVKAITERFELFKATFAPDDIRRAIVRALKSFAAVTLRDGGGVYWVPKPFAPAIRRLQSAVEKIGSSTFAIVPVHRTSEAERALGEAAVQSIDAEIALLKTEIESFVVAPPERASTLVRRFEVFSELRSKANLYRSILKAEVDDLDARLDALSTSVEKLLADKSVGPRCASDAAA